MRLPQNFESMQVSQLLALLTLCCSSRRLCHPSPVAIGVNRRSIAHHKSCIINCTSYMRLHLIELFFGLRFFAFSLELFVLNFNRSNALVHFVMLPYNAPTSISKLRNKLSKSNYNYRNNFIRLSQMLTFK